MQYKGNSLLPGNIKRDVVKLFRLANLFTASVKIENHVSVSHITVRYRDMKYRGRFNGGIRYTL